MKYRPLSLRVHTAKKIHPKWCLYCGEDIMPGQRYYYKAFMCDLTAMFSYVKYHTHCKHKDEDYGWQRVIKELL